jgi:molybdopterin molybdotransferase
MGADRIASSNNHALVAFARHFGANAIDLGVIADELTAIRTAIRKADRADILLTTGGASVGEHDLVRAALEAEGFPLAFWKIAMRPGKPMMFATRGRRRILGLPGNPVSALVCARIFVKPLIDRLLGLAPENPTVTARLGKAMKANDVRQDYVRATLERRPDGTLAATPFDIQDSSMQRTLAEADCLIIRPPHAPEAGAGSPVDVLPLDF